MIGGGGTQTVDFTAFSDFVSFDGVIGGGSIGGEAGADTFYFVDGGEVRGSTFRGDTGADSLTFGGTTVTTAQFGLGADADYLGGSISVGIGGVSFYSGSGNDTFNLTSVTQVGDSGTAYFWNEEGTDSIVIGGAVSSQLEGVPLVFGVTVGSSMNISFLANSIDDTATKSFGAGTMSSSWTVHNPWSASASALPNHDSVHWWWCRNLARWRLRGCRRYFYLLYS